MGTLSLSHVQPGGQHADGRKSRWLASSEIEKDAESNLHSFWMI